MYSNSELDRVLYPFLEWLIATLSSPFILYLGSFWIIYEVLEAVSFFGGSKIRHIAKVVLFSLIALALSKGLFR